jgi:hypothetical protein
MRSVVLRVRMRSSPHNLAFALNGYSFDGLAERHRQTLNREAVLRQASTPLQRYCLLNDCEPWECLAAVLNRMKRPDGSRRWKAVRLSEVFNGRLHPVRKTPDEVYAASAACFYQSQCIRSHTAHSCAWPNWREPPMTKSNLKMKRGE